MNGVLNWNQEQEHDPGNLAPVQDDYQVSSMSGVAGAKFQGGGDVNIKKKKLIV